jgi:predicted NAD/FAD-binding protein
MKRIAVIGSGISGLAAAHYLSRKHEVHVFEKDTRIGGHTNTIVTESSRGPLPVDTGFIVHNVRNYPNFCRLMTDLGVETGPSDMSFAVYSPSTGFEYSSRGARGYFAQKRNLLKPAHWNLFGEILRFNREAPKLLEQPPGELNDISIQQFLDKGHYQLPFIERYLYPMASAVWSMTQEAIAAFPAVTLIRFFQNHGMLGINTHPKWKVIRGGSFNYLGPLTRSFKERIQTGAEIESVERSESTVTLRFRGRPAREFSDVVFACHGNQILPLLTDAAPLERDVLSHFMTTANEAVLHRDSSLLPRRANARASWNYQLGEKGRVAVTYHMNRLQSLDVPEDYCVSLNANGDISPSKIIRKMVYHHPLYTQAAIRAQQRWHEISGIRRTHFCGAYWFYGFHEDGVNSALRVAKALGAA